MPRPTPNRVGEFFRRMIQRDDSTPEAPEAIGPDPAVVTMLRALGGALVQAGRATNETDDILHSIAHAYGRPEIRVLVMPTAIFIQLVGETTHTEMDAIDVRPMRLDQIGAIEKLTNDTLARRLEPQEVVAQLHAIRNSTPRFNDVIRVFGHVVLTLGFGLTLDPTVRAMPAYAILGAFVGVLIVVGRPGTIIGDAMPIVTAFGVTVLTGTLLEWAVHDDVVRVITPPLVSFLPGLALTIAAIELTHGQVIAGASRLVYGLSRLVTLAFGLVAGIAVVGPISPHPAGDQLGWWAPLAGVVLTALGYTLFSGAPKGSWAWFVLVLFLVLSAQRIGSNLLSPELSGFVGALIIIPLTRTIELLPRAPSSAVTMLPALWILVPGALGFIGITEAATDEGTGLESLIDMGLAMFAISLGVLVGSGIVRDVTRAKTTWSSIE